MWGKDRFRAFCVPMFCIGKRSGKSLVINGAL